MLSKISFGLGISTGAEGLMYPIPYASVREVVEISVLAEELGFDSVWGNDHITTQQYVLNEFGKQPRYYAPLITLAAIAERTKTLKIATALLVIPFRNPVIIAKELATLDNLSDGRLIVGVGLGAYREEFEAEFGAKAKDLVRGKMLDESLYLVNRMFNEESVTYDGEYFSIKNVNCFPKPVQKSFPFYIGGNSDKGLDRVVKCGTGWLPACLTVEEISDGVNKLKEKFRAAGREYNIDVAPQMFISIAPTKEEAVEKWEKSQLCIHANSLQNSTFKGRDLSDYFARNIIGSPEDVIKKIDQYIEAGVTRFSALLFPNNNIEETREDMKFFADTVIKHYNK